MRTLANRGAEELVIVAVDTNQYGMDFGDTDNRRLADLLRAADGMVPWIWFLKDAGNRKNLIKNRKFPPLIQ